MGKSKKSRHKSISKMIYERLSGMLSVGRSKSEDKKTGEDRDRIYSYNTYRTYREQGNAFAQWMAEKHPEITTMRKARRCVPEYMQGLVDTQKSAWTINTANSALNKIFGITPDDPDYFSSPPRERKDIKRSRGEAARDKQFSERNNLEFVNFCRGTGLRSSELKDLRGRDLISRGEIADQIHDLEAKDLSANDAQKLAALQDALIHPTAEYYLLIRNGKGGKMRYAPIIGPDSAAIVQRMDDTPDYKKVWAHVPSKADIHAYRAEYCTRIYKDLAREIKDIPYDKTNKGTGRKYQSQVYCCRKDESHKHLDKAAMQVASKAMGHNRLDVIAEYYLRGV